MVAGPGALIRYAGNGGPTGPLTPRLVLGTPPGVVVGVVGGIHGIGGGSTPGPILVGLGLPVAVVAPAALGTHPQPRLPRPRYDPCREGSARGSVSSTRCRSCPDANSVQTPVRSRVAALPAARSPALTPHRTATTLPDQVISVR